MLNRPKYPKQRNVFLINDVPNKVELENEEKWSSTSNLNYLTSLRTGKILNYGKSDEVYPYPIKSTDIYTSYLDMDYYGSDSIEKNYDFNKEILQYKELTKLHENDETIYVSKEIPDLKFIKLEYFKDLYLSERLYNQFNNLLNEIKLVKPLIIVTSGKWITMLLTGLSTVAQNKGKPGESKPLGIINTYRTSLEKPHPSLGLDKCIIYPMIHPVNIHTMPDKHYLLEMDLQKLGYTYHKVINDGFPSIEDNRKYIIKPDKFEILNYLDNIIAECDIKETIVSIDIETLFFSIIDCIGITTKITEGICIPFSENGKPHYWSLEDETDILLKIYDLFTHKNCIHLGQNYSYEIQNYLKSWGLNVPIGHDTLVLHHILYNYLPKDLGFLASIYSEDYRYWKNERNESSEIRWTYNIKDICYTLEVFYNLYDILQTYSEKTQELYRFQLDRLSPILIERMYKGIRVDKSMKDELYTFFSKLMEDVTKSINDDMGFEFNINSTPQKKKVFKDLLQMDLEKKRVKNASPKETCDAESMLIYMDKYPLYKPLLQRMLEYGSLKVFTSTFLKAELEPNGRMATSYKVAGTATGRLSSSKNIWGRGCNLQNIPSKGKINLIAAIEAIDEEDDFYSDEYIEGSISLPNVKKMFLPDVGYEIADLDFDGADIRVVAAEAECKWLLDFFENPQGKVYKYISSLFYQREITDDEYKTQKAIYHGSNYGLGIAKLAVMGGIDITTAKKLQDFYFTLNPEVKKWQEDTQKQISKLGYIENIYGRRAWFVNKNDVTLLNKALAFKPQSTIGDSINRVIDNVVSSDTNVDMLLQVHDSGVFQYPISQAVYYRNHILDKSQLTLDYNGIKMPLPTDIKWSQVSYGDCK